MAKTNKTLFSVSEGQAHHYLRLNCILYAINSSVITRLNSRSLSGQSSHSSISPLRL